ncbi:potassium channel protein - like protein [Prosthecobacter fluviatilis]|uniref:Potassium channel protein - like protein n=1 Tax=Prosthecobacter fluviatilis TaxID=445931 RepID=A0ABW0KPG1_9BACT
MSASSIPSQAPQGSNLRQGLMLVVAVAFLSVVGLVLPHGDSGEEFRAWLMAHAFFRPFVIALWLVVILEGIAGLFAAHDAWPARLKRLLLTTLLPPLRMITASSQPAGWLWLPGIGWKPVGEDTTEQLEQKLALPMLILTLLVLPVLGAELTGGETLENHPRMALATHLMTCIIWIGFTMEFLWMVAAAPAKLAYCLKNWINLVIILLPLIAFLRVLNIFRFTRMLRAGKLLRAYRLRGLWTRLWRLALLFNLIERLQRRDPARYCASLEKKIADLEEELAKLRGRLAEQREKLPHR